jgi:signal transduction histidine kinase/ABC-type multidrug transport system ATPase subunit
MTVSASPAPTVAGRAATPGPPELLASVRGLSVSLGGRLVLDGIDLDVRAGEVVAVVGENGAGKTTLVRCLAGELRPGAGTVHLPAGRAALGIVWQDLSLCDQLDVVANVWLGRETGWLDEARLEVETRRLLARLGLELPDLRRPVGTLSGGERQLVAVARALAGHPELCVLDEPTSALSLAEARTVDTIVRELRARGGAALLVTHEPEATSGLADRVVVLRRGRVVATPAGGELHPDDLLAVMAGTEVESTARRQLRRLRDLVDQLDQSQPSAALPVVVSAAGAALGQERLCVHLLDEPPDGPARLRAAAAVGLSAAFAEVVADLPLGAGGGPVGLAAATRAPAVVEALEAGPAGWPEVAVVAAADGIAASWAVPLVGRRGVLGVLSGYDTTAGGPSDDRLALVSLYAAQAATAVERAALLEEVTRRNDGLETLRSMLERLAGPEGATDGPSVALAALARGLAARGVALFRRTGPPAAPPATHGVALAASYPSPGEEAAGAGGRLAALEGAALALLAGAGPAADPGGLDLPPSSRSVHVDEPGGLGVLRAPGTLAVRFSLSGAPAVLAAAFDGDVPDGATDVLVDATRSLRLSVEREALEAARRESDAAQRSSRLAREFLSRLSHELRTPLTAIRGYASSLCQADVTFDAATTERFLTNIASESARLARLVSDLLDATALDSGALRLQCDWCDVTGVVRAALAAVPGGESVAVQAPDGLPAVWADHDRLCQVVVNLVENALRHTPEGTAVQVGLSPAGPGTLELRVTDDGPGVSAASAEELFLPWHRGSAADDRGRAAGRGGGAGLGLSIARGIVDAHGGSVTVEPAPMGTTFLVRLPVEPPEGAGRSWEPVEVEIDD